MGVHVASAAYLPSCACILPCTAPAYVEVRFHALLYVYGMGVHIFRALNPFTLGMVLVWGFPFLGSFILGRRPVDLRLSWRGHR